VILIRWKKKVALVVYGSNIEFCFTALDALAAGLVMAVDNFVADGPQYVPLVPDAGQNVCCPELSCLLFGADAFVVQVIVLETGPFCTESTVKYLSPSNHILLVDKGGVNVGEAGEIRDLVIKPCLNAGKENILEIRPGVNGVACLPE
jgi:hypothetical protein